MNGLVGLLGALALGGCGNRDPRDPAGAFALLVEALKERSCPKLLERLDRATLTEVTAIHQASRATLELIQNRYPEKQRQTELRNLEILAHVRGSSDVPSFFISWCGSEFPLERVGASDLAGAKARSVEIAPDGEQATVTSRAGDKFLFRKNPNGTWGTSWLFEDYRKVAEASNRNLGLVRERAKSFGVAPPVGP